MATFTIASLLSLSCNSSFFFNKARISFFCLSESYHWKSYIFFSENTSHNHRIFYLGYHKSKQLLMELHNHSGIPTLLCVSMELWYQTKKNIHIHYPFSFFWTRLRKKESMVKENETDQWRRWRNKNDGGAAIWRRRVDWRRTMDFGV